MLDKSTLKWFLDAIDEIRQGRHDIIGVLADRMYDEVDAELFKAIICRLLGVGVQLQTAQSSTIHSSTIPKQELLVTSLIMNYSLRSPREGEHFYHQSGKVQKELNEFVNGYWGKVV